MKTSKKLVSLLLTLALIFAMSSTAFAAGPYKITINGDKATGHTYEAYQIFSGDVSNTTLANIAWGNGVVPAAILTDLANDQINFNGISATSTASDVAAALNDSNSAAFAKIAGAHLATVAGTSESGVISGLDSGYYLVKDKTDTVPAGGSYTNFVVKIVGADITANPKSDVPTVEKKVKDINNSTNTDYTNWQDSADHDVGDKVPFQLKATLPSNYDSYSSYQIIFHDTMSKGLTYNATAPDKAVVKIDGHDVTDSFTITPEAQTDGSTKLTVSCENIKAIEGVTITKNSVITVEYNATLNSNAVLGSTGNPNEVTLEYSNNPNGTGTGTTPKDTVIVFTYKVVVNKVDQNQNALTGAEFTLEKYDKTSETWKAVGKVKNDAGTIFTFSGLDDGNYKLTETTTPAGYNTIAPIEFTVVAEHDIDAVTPTLTSLTGDVTTGNISFTQATDHSSLTTNVVNKSGSTLPETGAMGTTMLYIIGGILVAATAVILITKKRMTKES